MNNNEIEIQDITPRMFPFDDWVHEDSARHDNPVSAQQNGRMSIGGYGRVDFKNMASTTVSTSDAIAVYDESAGGYRHGYLSGLLAAWKSTTFPVYSTGWINRSDWTNVHLGSDDTKDNDSDVSHGLGADLGALDVELYVSSNGAWSTAQQIVDYQYFDYGEGVRYRGWAVWEISTDTVRVQTGKDGLHYLSDSGQHAIVNDEDWYYNVVVRKVV